MLCENQNLKMQMCRIMSRDDGQRSPLDGDRYWGKHTLVFSLRSHGVLAQAVTEDEIQDVLEGNPLLFRQGERPIPRSLYKMACSLEEAVARLDIYPIQVEPSPTAWERLLEVGF